MEGKWQLDSTATFILASCLFTLHFADLLYFRTGFTFRIHNIIYYYQICFSIKIQQFSCSVQWALVNQHSETLYLVRRNLKKATHPPLSLLKINVASVNKPDGGMLHVLDSPGTGDPMLSKKEFAEMFLAQLVEKMAGKNLKTIIIVKKSNDFRVLSEHAWYVIILKTIIDKGGFDMSKLIFAVTFSDQQELDTTLLNEFVDQLWKVTGFESKGIAKPRNRCIRHGRDSKPADILGKVLELMPVETVHAINSTLDAGFEADHKKNMEGAAGGVKDHDEATSCFKNGQ